MKSLEDRKRELDILEGKEPEIIILDNGTELMDDREIFTRLKSISDPQKRFNALLDLYTDIKLHAPFKQHPFYAHPENRRLIQQFDHELDLCKKEQALIPTPGTAGENDLWTNKGYAKYNKTKLSEKINKDVRSVGSYLKDEKSFLQQYIVDTKEGDKETLYLISKGSIKILREHYGKGKHKKDF